MDINLPFDYTFVVVSAIDCLTTTKICFINGTYQILPTSKVLVYTSMDVNLN